MSSRLCLQACNFQIITAFINDFNNLYDCLNGLLIYRSADKKIAMSKLGLFRFFNNTTKWTSQLEKNEFSISRKYFHATYVLIIYYLKILCMEWKI